MKMIEKNFYIASDKLPFMGTEGKKLLSESNVLVIGAGGLGCPCLIALASIGVGNLGIADFDTVEESNLQRQMIYRYDDICEKKVKVAKQYINKLNPFILVKEYDILVDIENVLELIKPFDVIIDGTDNFEVRYLINDACVFLNKPLVYGAIHQSEGHFTVFNYQNSGTLRCLFPENEQNEELQSCASIGVYSVNTMIIGTYMANEVVKVVLNMPDINSQKLVCVNSIEASINKYSFIKKTESIDISLNRFLHPETKLGLKPNEIIDKFRDKALRWIDIRDEIEFRNSFFKGENFPLNKLLEGSYLSEFCKSDFLILICSTGFRSKKAVQYFNDNEFFNVFFLKNGLRMSENDLITLKNL